MEAVTHDVCECEECRERRIVHKLKKKMDAARDVMLTAAMKPVDPVMAHLLDVYAAIGVAWGSDPFGTIEAIKNDATLAHQSRRTCPDHGEYISQCPACSTPGPASDLPFGKALEQLLNRYSMENGSNTPDFLLVDYLIDCLTAFERLSKKREKWYGVELKPGQRCTATEGYEICHLSSGHGGPHQNLRYEWPNGEAIRQVGGEDASRPRRR